MNTYIGLDIISITALILLTNTQRLNSFFNNKMKRTFSFAAYLTIAVLLADIGTVLFDNNSVEYRNISIISNMLGFALSPLPGVALSGAFTTRQFRQNWPFLLPVVLNLILAFSSPWTGSIFYVSPENQYSRGPLFGIYVIAYICSLILVVIESIKASKYYQCRTKTTLVLLFAYILGGTSLQVFMPELHTSLLCVTLSLVVYYSYFCEFIETQDAMTGLLNRRAYEFDLFRMDRRGYGTIIMFDVDDFKNINDQHGHQWGDECLNIIGEAIKDTFSGYGFCYRIGGDELCVLCKTQDEKKVEETISAFHHKIGAIRGNYCNLPMVSVGYSLFSNSDESIASAINEADKRMYHFKARRKQENSSTLSEAGRSPDS